METAENINELDNYIDRLGLTYSAVFVPQSKSRNAGEKQPSLNWKVTVSKGRDELTTDYMQGICHAPGYEQSFTQSGWKDKYFAHVAEKGRTLNILPKMSNGKTDWYEALERMGGYGLGLKGKWNANLPELALKDVLYSLISDSDVLNYSDFEDWAKSLGYEADSRKAEKTYNDCIAIALKLRSIIGQVAMDGLQDLFQDY